MKNKLLNKTILLTTLLVGGLVISVFYDHTDSDILKTGSLLMILGGFITLFSSPLGITRPDASTKRPLPTADTAKKIGFGIVICIGVFVVVMGGKLLNYRMVEYILDTQKVQNAIATVVKIEERRAKTTSHFYAIINYKAGKETIKQAINANSGPYSENQRLNIIYSVAHPEMFRILETSKPDSTAGGL